MWSVLKELATPQTYKDMWTIIFIAGGCFVGLCCAKFIIFVLEIIGSIIDGILSLIFDR
jgi:hypothetical protein